MNSWDSLNGSFPHKPLWKAHPLNACQINEAMTPRHLELENKAPNFNEVSIQTLEDICWRSKLTNQLGPTLI